MNIIEVCHRGVVSIDSEASPGDAASKMRTHHVGTLVVTAAHDGVQRVVGMLTDRDLATEVLGRELDADGVTVGQLASRQIVSVPAEAGVFEAVAAMRKHGVRRLLVTGAQNELTGIVSADDILESIAVELAGLSSALRSSIEREAAQRPAQGSRPAFPVFLPYGTPGLQAGAPASFQA